MRNIIKAIVIIAALTTPALAEMTAQDWAKVRMRSDLQSAITVAQLCWTKPIHDNDVCTRELQLLQDQLALLGSH
jgi:hypothetical protein